jgi:hypothetical protein
MQNLGQVLDGVKIDREAQKIPSINLETRTFVSSQAGTSIFLYVKY